MNNKALAILAALIAASVLLLQGCSEIEPKTGTRVTFALPGKNVPRSKIVALSVYLINRGQRVIGVERPRVDRVTEDSLVLLLPGRNVPRRDVSKLITPTSIELYHLRNVATRNHPDSPWRLKRPASSRSGSYVFVGPDAKRIDSDEDPRDLLREVVGVPAEKPVLTGKDTLPGASTTRTTTGWAVSMKFNSRGARTFYEFTKRNPGEYLAVFHNGTLVSAPVIEKPISGGKAFITGFKTESQACIAVEELNAGVIPLNVKVRSVTYY